MEEQRWIDSKPDDASLAIKFKQWNDWWDKQKEIRIKAHLRAEAKAHKKRGWWNWERCVFVWSRGFKMDCRFLFMWELTSFFHSKAPELWFVAFLI